MSKINETLKIAVSKGYYVDNDGNAHSKRQKLKGRVNTSGYYVITISVYGKGEKILIHRLMGYQKFGESMFEEGMEIRHLDGNSLNNSYDNISIGTHSDNMFDIPKEIRQYNSKHARKKYSDELIEQLKIERNKGLTYKELHQKYNISKCVLSYYLGKDTRKRKQVIF